MSDPKEEIKARLSVVDLIREYIPLQAAGVYSKARCPFHQEQTPSFMVNSARQMWHCFGCNIGGDIFAFVMKYEGLSFPEALRLLAEKTGVEIQTYDRKTANDRDRILEVLDVASRYYHQAFLRAPQAESARQYAYGRHLDTSCVDDFRLGYALNERDALYRFLISRSFQAGDMIAAGLALKNERGYGAQDRFRDRLMIPVRDVNGRIVGFAGRLISDVPGAAKYINSPQTLVYDKGKLVFGLHSAKQEIRVHDAVIIVEGYMDVFAVHRAGMGHVVASSGTALTVDQIRLLKRYTSTCLFAFDADIAGAQATVRAIEHALSEGMHVKVILLPKKEDGSLLWKDPDECIEHDSAAWKNAVEHAVSFLDFHFDRLSTPAARVDAYQIKKAAHELVRLISILPDRIEQDVWIKKLAREFQLSEHVLWEELLKGGKGSIGDIRARENVSVAGSSGESQGHTVSIEDRFLSLCLRYPDLCLPNLRDFSEEILSHDDNKEIYKSLRSWYTKTNPLGDKWDVLILDKNDKYKERVGILELFADKEYSNFEERDVCDCIRQLSQRLGQEYERQKRMVLEGKIREAEACGDTAALTEYLREFQIHISSRSEERRLSSQNTYEKIEEDQKKDGGSQATKDSSSEG